MSPISKMSNFLFTEQREDNNDENIRGEPFIDGKDGLNLT